MHVFWPLFYLFLCHGDHWTWAVLEMADNLLLCMGKAFPPWWRECVYLLTLRQGHSLVQDRERKKGKEMENGGRAVEEWEVKASAMQMDALQPWIIQSVEWKSCFSDPLSLTSAGVGHSHLGSFGLRTSHSVPSPSPYSLTLSLCTFALAHFTSSSLEATFSFCFFIETMHACCPLVSLRSSALISHVASFLPNCLKRIERRRKEAPLCFYGPNFLVQLICGLYAASSHGGYRWWTFVRAVSKPFLLKELRERIISHLLNIRFIHNAAGVFIEQVLFPLLIAAMVALVELDSCAPSCFSVSPPNLSLIFEK